MIEHDTQKIVAFKVTDERTGDSPQFEGLLEDSLECLGIDADRLLETPGRKGQMTRRTRHSPGLLTRRTKGMTIPEGVRRDRTGNQSRKHG